ncbi:hypothetical protein ARMGADRAFT_1033922 [Armillaria gallica]|uniref:Uncharacterized protein n=1 Tax=Armillaria gallica TaxID=47427 RepID=A0A2H3D484_ARMGA|nr:hypothetical protein ARMGADRAFT_1033922 [Armillaria gallica]
MLIGVLLLGSAPLASLLMLVMGRDEKSMSAIGWGYMGNGAPSRTLVPITQRFVRKSRTNSDDGEGLNDAAGMNANALRLQPSWSFSQGLMLALMLKPLLLMLAYGGGMPIISMAVAFLDVSPQEYVHIDSVNGLEWYQLVGVVYFGNSHFTVRYVDPNRLVWFNDGVIQGR